MINLHTAIFALNPSIVTVHGDVAYDANQQEVAYDKVAAETKLAQLQAEEATKKQDVIVAKESAMSKLAAIGLTPAEITTLLGA